MRPRPAPRAVRIAISFCRALARARNRLAMFAHPTSSTERDCRQQNRQRRTRATHELFHQRHDLQRRAERHAGIRLLPSARGSSRSRRGRFRSKSRASALRPSETAGSCRLAAAGRRCRGRRRSLRSQAPATDGGGTRSARKPAGSTPAMVVWRPATIAGLPTTSGLPPNHRSKKACDSSTSDWPGPGSRPKAGRAAAISQKSSVTVAIRAGADVPATVIRPSYSSYTTRRSSDVASRHAWKSCDVTNSSLIRGSRVVSHTTRSG